MRYFFLILVLAMCYQLSAQITDDFNADDMLISLNWKGDRANFKINSSGQLQLNATSAGNSRLVSNYTIDTAMEITFTIKISFNTSINNYARVYLLADSSAIDASLNSLYWSFGENNDSVKLIEKKGSAIKTIYSCKTISTSQTVNTFRFSLNITSLNILCVKIQKDDETAYIVDDSVKYILTQKSNSNFGIYCKYTVSNASKIYFDDIFIGIKHKLITEITGDKPKPEMLLISEVLFNPFDEGVDFVELYNNSTSPLDLKNIYISNKYTSSGILKDVCKLTDKSIVLQPFTYLLLSSNYLIVQQQYNTLDTIRFIDLIRFPAFNNDEGYVVISNDSAQIIDEMHYIESMHFELLNSFEGISLERISFLTSSLVTSNWHSSSSISKATPGIINSQYLQEGIQSEEIQLSSAVFSPDNNGKDDILSIQYKLARNDILCNIFIYNDKGELVRNLANNDLIATSGMYVWNGLNDNGSMLNPGQYVVFIDFFNTTGYKKTYKKVVVLACDK